jgi:hypothetical protein
MDTISRQRAALAFVVLSVLSVGGAAALRRHEATPALGAAAEPRAGGEAARAREADGPLDAAADARATARLAMSAAQASADETYVAEAVSEHAARAENREQAFRVDVTRGRLEVASHAAEGATPGFELTLGLVAAGREGETLDVTPARTATAGNQIRVLREGLLEWFVNGPLGLEQGFELSERPAGEGPLRFELEVEGLRPEARGSFIALLDEAGVQQARYSDLYALDAEGDDVPAHMHVSDGRIVLEVDDRNARYPLVVDPLVSTQEARLCAERSREHGPLRRERGRHDHVRAGHMGGGGCTLRRRGGQQRGRGVCVSPQRRRQRLGPDRAPRGQRRRG